MGVSVAEVASRAVRVVVVVDPYSSGRYLVQELQQQQYTIIGIQSSHDLADFWLEQYDESLFLKTVLHKNWEQTLAELAGFEILAVLPGSEPGVLLAEDLQDHFGLPGNGGATKEWRRDKYPMQERLREVGLRAIRQIYSNDIDEMIAWQAEWGKWPVIVKPAMSGGTDGVYWCHSVDDVRHAHSVECGKMNVNGVVNDKLLVQEYLDGLEYIIDCVSHEGKHVLSGIWVYKKTKDPATRSIAYEYARLLESTGKEQDILVEYTHQVLDALNIRFGPSHTEVIITEDGPCLVETGARMHGCKGPKLTEYGTGIGTHELVVDVALNGARIFNDIHTKSARYTVKKWAFETMFRNVRVEGPLAEDIDVPEIRQLSSVLDIFPSIKKGEELQITRDLATSPGVILQCHPSLEQCFADLERIRSLEETTLYKIAKSAGSPTGSPKMMFAGPSVMSPVQQNGAPRKMSDFALTGFDLDPSTDIR